MANDNIYSIIENIVSSLLTREYGFISTAVQNQNIITKIWKFEQCTPLIYFTHMITGYWIFKNINSNVNLHLIIKQVRVNMAAYCVLLLYMSVVERYWPVFNHGYQYIRTGKMFYKDNTQMLFI